VLRGFGGWRRSEPVDRRQVLDERVTAITLDVTSDSEIRRAAEVASGTQLQRTVIHERTVLPGVPRFGEPDEPYNSGEFLRDICWTNDSFMYASPED
jgi:hypothetical protein